MQLSVPEPISGGLMLSYKCNAECLHCMYACSPQCNGDWISKNRLEQILNQLAGRIEPSPYGANSISTNQGLHFTGGEPFLNFDLLAKGIEIADGLDIPSIFVETNCSWCGSEESIEEKLEHLKSLGLKGIMISVNPFYLEYVPFRKTKKCIKVSKRVFGRNVMVYQRQYYRKFERMGIEGTLNFEEYVEKVKPNRVLSNVEFFMMGRSPFKIPQKMAGKF